VWLAGGKGLSPELAKRLAEAIDAMQTSDAFPALCRRYLSR